MADRAAPAGVGCDVETIIRVEGEYVKARSGDCAGPSTPKLSEHLRCADALRCELQVTMLREPCEHLIELGDRNPKAVIIAVRQNVRIEMPTTFAHLPFAHYRGFTGNPGRIVRRCV